MNDKLTDSVARLYRAGSEYSQSTQKLRVAADGLLKWLKENVPDGFALPCECRMYPSGEFVQEGLTNPPLGTTREVFKITLGQEHSRYELWHFSQLIAEGFIDKLAETLDREATTFAKSADLVTDLTGPSVDTEFAKMLGIDLVDLLQMSPQEVFMFIEWRLKHLARAIHNTNCAGQFEMAVLNHELFRTTYRFFKVRGITLKPEENYYKSC